MQKTWALFRRVGQARLVGLSLLLLGIFALAFSIVYTSSMLGFIGLGLTFWGALFLYITPSKHVPLELLNAMVTPALTNIEKMLKTFNLKEKGIYLPPKSLEDFESSVVFIPLKDRQTQPNPEKTEIERLYQQTPNGVLLTPPGNALAKLFEKKLGASFIGTDLDYVQKNLPKLLIEDMEIAEDVTLKIENNIVTIKIMNHIFTQICQEARKLEKTPKAIGCPLSSSIAIILTRAVRKPVIIKENSMSQDAKTVEIQYQIIEE